MRSAHENQLTRPTSVESGQHDTVEVCHRHRFRELPFGMVPKHRSVVLTFDDGPDVHGHTDRILDILADKSAKATFFVTSANQEAGGLLPPRAQAAATLRRMRDEGHEVGNHTAHHPELKDLDPQAICRELDVLDAFVGEAWGAPNLRLSLVRAPYGRPMYPHDRCRTPAVFDKVAACFAGRAVHVGWTMDTNDWQKKSAEDVVADALALVDASENGGILLMHSIWGRTCEALPRIIDGIRARGYALSTCEAYVEETFGCTSQELVLGAPPESPKARAA